MEIGKGREGEGGEGMDGKGVFLEILWGGYGYRRGFNTIGDGVMNGPGSGMGHR